LTVPPPTSCQLAKLAELRGPRTLNQRVLGSQTWRRDTILAVSATHRWPRRSSHAAVRFAVRDRGLAV